MTARKNNDLRSLIEEAISLLRVSYHGQSVQMQKDKCVNMALGHICEALSLLPESTPPGGWQEFDPNREETWPKPKEMPEWFLVCRSDCGVSWDTWGNEGWESDENGLTLAWMPLPPPYVKP